MAEKEHELTWFQRIERLHPYETLLYLGMIGSGLIFLFLTVAFLFSGRMHLAGMNQSVPTAFLISTFLLVISGFTATSIRLAFQEENTEKLLGSLRNTVLLGLIFSVLQVVGWYELEAKGIAFTGIPSGSFLYVLSGIHVFHLLGAMIFALILYVQLAKGRSDQIHKLIIYTNPFEKMRLRLFTVYWHFMDAIWLVLFLLFVVSI
ncbi:cytochrome c oxidase subunit 3 [Algoriphagus halophytocola]|uniref:Cytochrome c oxidase subunit 3 n=1 Tax=Algoriphagus halophytocola TaxID=2991499 RepID=A0ABY6MH21_9BACT|nr:MULTISPECIES: cytochrome c oxidase subunit 3 [unclassified Algoriphagus]UZD21504.1 cytochrome c oxidase subunit 3 [Algoriphagus sp. TR-M5]WBL42716.1 cytochrome c oxidase subunit 3 [Algoriphagus sp. TR-M9]